MKEAAYYSAVSAEDKTLRCVLCPHHCFLTDGKTGICLARRNIGGILYSLVHLRPVSAAIDPIEKKPLYHFHPGSHIFSSGPNGCTFKCRFCQNCEISQTVLSVREIPSAAFVKSILDSGTIGIAYTYSEPFVWFETIMEIGAIVREHGLVNVMVTNGFMEQKPLADLLTLVDAMNIDIKSMNPAFYRRLCKARLEPVLAACETVKKKCHLEITNLIIPGENDSEKEIRLLVDWIAANLGRDTPLHFSQVLPAIPDGRATHAGRNPPARARDCDATSSIMSTSGTWIPISATTPAALRAAPCLSKEMAIPFPSTSPLRKMHPPEKRPVLPAISRPTSFFPDCLSDKFHILLIN